VAAQIPDPIERRNLLHLEQKKPVDFAAIAEAYLALGRKSDALDFADRASDQAKRASIIGRVREDAIKLGDAFLVGRCHHLIPVAEADWRRTLEAAKAAGKTRYALKIARRLNDAAEIAAQEKVLGINQPPPMIPGVTPDPALPAPASPALPAPAPPAAPGPTII
jgi:hypothetical protein